MAQSPRHAWAIMDTPMTATMEIADPYYRDGDKVVRAKVVELLDTSPFIRKADTLAELAEQDARRQATFLGTVERYNKACAQRLETEPEFGKPLKVVEGVRHAALLRGADLSAGAQEFRRREDRPAMPRARQAFRADRGLYAAGEIAGMAGGHINGRAGLEGTMLGPSVFSGRVAGGWAAHEAGHGSGFVGKPNRG